MGLVLEEDVVLRRSPAKEQMVPEEDKQVKSKYLIYLLSIHFED